MGSLSNPESSMGRYKLVYQLPNQILVVINASTGKAHVSFEGGIFESA